MHLLIYLVTILSSNALHSIYAKGSSSLQEMTAEERNGA